jgi:single-strand DNA-binding protein
MSLNYNRVTLAGNLTRDPQVRFFANERAVADFGLAINRKFKANDGSLKEETTFVDVEAWGRTAELVGQYLTKGSGCFIEGRLKLDSWDDKKTGEKRSKIKVVADSVQFLGGRGERGGQGPGAEGGADLSQGDNSSSDAGAIPARPAPSRPAPAAAGDDEPPF